MKRQFIEKADPVTFTYVMATATLSSALTVTKWSALSQIFLFLATLGYLFLCAIFTLRFLASLKLPRKEKIKTEDLFKYLAFSAGTNCLAVRFSLTHQDLIGLILCLIGVISTLFLNYLIFFKLLFHQSIPLLLITPFWLLMPIACHSSGIAISTLWTNEILSQPLWLLGASMFWNYGVFIYIIFMVLTVYRIFFFPLKRNDLHPAYWTCMGAAAIAVFDGSRLILIENPPLFLEIIRPFVQGMVFLLWIWGTAWIPLLILMGGWKYAYFQLPFHYEPSLWTIVFPLGMYTLATEILPSSISLHLVQGIVPILLWITLFAWLFIAYKSKFIPWQKQEDTST
jgi:tellurite resistance protein TehA-like permease